MSYPCFFAISAVLLMKFPFSQFPLNIDHNIQMISIIIHDCMNFKLNSLFIFTYRIIIPIIFIIRFYYLKCMLWICLSNDIIILSSLFAPANVSLSAHPKTLNIMKPRNNIQYNFLTTLSPYWIIQSASHKVVKLQHLLDILFIIILHRTITYLLPL